MNLKAIKNKIFNGKNPKFIYYIRAYVMTHIPRALLRPALSKLDSIIEQRADRDYILDRVNYYCKNSSYPEVARIKVAGILHSIVIIYLLACHRLIANIN